MSEWQNLVCWQKRKVGNSKIISVWDLLYPSLISTDHLAVIRLSHTLHAESRKRNSISLITFALQKQLSTFFHPIIEGARIFATAKIQISVTYKTDPNHNFAKLHFHFSMLCCLPKQFYVVHQNSSLRILLLRFSLMQRFIKFQIYLAHAYF